MGLQFQAGFGFGLLQRERLAKVEKLLKKILQKSGHLA